MSSTPVTQSAPLSPAPSDSLAGLELMEELKAPSMPNIFEAARDLIESTLSQPPAVRNKPTAPPSWVPSRGKPPLMRPSSSPDRHFHGTVPGLVHPQPGYMTARPRERIARDLRHKGISTGHNHPLLPGTMIWHRNVGTAPQHRTCGTSFSRRKVNIVHLHSRCGTNL
ncbi:hypothetical protein UY3_15289 [Chelonia mydas]|uniref:Uncharacterized protein n=1 Tax=Chelonia mydas TaxID=8469 RepID=M7AQM0_CHEMY|nr:hypothetical protein UY3_15289 [Chelonia mydas]